MTPLEALRHHVSGAIARGEKEPILGRDVADCAFESAIAAGRLSSDPRAPNYAGYYMFMGTRDGRDKFKHRYTRGYIA